MTEKKGPHPRRRKKQKQGGAGGIVARGAAGPLNGDQKAINRQTHGGAAWVNRRGGTEETLWETQWKS